MTRQEPKRRRGRRAPGRGNGTLLVVGGLALAGLVLFAWSRLASSNGGTSSGSVPCSRAEMTVEHEHAHLAIVIRGRQATVPANVGIRADCLYWLHTHNASGVIHIEAGTPGTYTLGQFFSVWGEPLSSTSVLGETVGAGESLRVLVDGTTYSGDPRSIPLAAHRQIAIELGPPFPEPTPFVFPPGL